MKITSKCLICKGRNCLKYCGKQNCETCRRLQTKFMVASNIKQEFSAESPAPFIGRFGYPDINVGVLSAPDNSANASSNSSGNILDASLYDAPRVWSANNYNIPSLVDIRSSLVNSRTNFNVRDARSTQKLSAKMLEVTQDVGMSSKPVDIEVKLKKVPTPKLHFFDINAPMGPTAQLKNLTETSNPNIDSRVWKVVDSYDLKAQDAINELYNKSDSFDENFLSKILSVGMLGAKTQRKLVPTRWSITATDDIIAKQLITEIKDFPVYDYVAYFGGYLGNYYLILFFPEVWSYELFEMYSPNGGVQDGKIQFSTDYENYFGRKEYAEQCAGGYYTVRLGILERLKQLKRQGSVLALRFMTDDYSVPLGVWVTREATRKSVSNKPIVFGSKELLLNYAKIFAKKKFGMELGQVFGKSRLLAGMKQQKLVDYI
ncbi:hypothetical protein J4206_05460 [Candidatus Woesearchaeota archaeon]|nr:hypothetical protein [Candidatus Woesearchaeota archaeon]